MDERTSKNVPVAPKASVGVPRTGASTGSGVVDGVGSVRKSVLFLGLVALVYLGYLVVSGQMVAFVDSMRDVDVRWVVGACALYVVYYLLGVSAYAVAVAGDPASPITLRDLMSVEASGIFFSNLTPNGTGGAPAQIYRLTRAGLSVGGAGALQYTRFIIYEAGEGIFAALMLVPRLGWFLDSYGNVVLVGALLFGAKVVEVAGLLVVCLFPSFVTRVGTWALRWLRRRGWIRPQRYERWSHVVTEQVGEFSAGFRAGAREGRLMAITLLVTLVQLGCLYALPWFVLRAFGRSVDLVTCLAAGSMLELLTSAIPLPGGTGGAEGGFAFLFGSMFGEALPAGYVVWRMIEYVLPVLAAVPLMGLRPQGGPNVYEQLRRLRGRVHRLQLKTRPTATIRAPRPHDRDDG